MIGIESGSPSVFNPINEDAGGRHRTKRTSSNEEIFLGIIGGTVVGVLLAGVVASSIGGE